MWSKLKKDEIKWLNERNLLDDFENWLDVLKNKSGMTSHPANLSIEEQLFAALSYSEGNYQLDIAKHFNVSRELISKVVIQINRELKKHDIELPDLSRNLTPDDVKFLKIMGIGHKEFSDWLDKLDGQYYNPHNKKRPLLSRKEMLIAALYKMGGESLDKIAAYFGVAKQIVSKDINWVNEVLKHDIQFSSLVKIRILSPYAQRWLRSRGIEQKQFDEWANILDDTFTAVTRSTIMRREDMLLAALYKSAGESVEDIAIHFGASIRTIYYCISLVDKALKEHDIDLSLKPWGKRASGEKADGLQAAIPENDLKCFNINRDKINNEIEKCAGLIDEVHRILDKEEKPKRLRKPNYKGDR